MTTGPGRGEEDRDAVLPLTIRDRIPGEYTEFRIIINCVTRNSCPITDGGVFQDDEGVDYLADVHQIDTDDKIQFAVPEPESQHTLGKWTGGSA